MTALAVLLACSAALIVAALRFPWKAHRHYLRWTRRAPWVGLLAYLVLSAVAGGLLGYGFARWSGWSPENVVVRGLAWGLFGAAVLRVQLNSLPGPELAGSAVSAVGAAGAFVLGLVDDAVETVAGHRLEQLPDAALAQYVYELYAGGVAIDPTLSEVEQKDLLGKIDAAATALLEGTEAEKLQARAYLRQSGKRWAVKYAFEPPAA